MIDVQSETERQINEKVAQQARNEVILENLITVLRDLRAAKPNEGSEIARRYAITITDLEKVIICFQAYVVFGSEEYVNVPIQLP